MNEPVMLSDEQRIEPLQTAVMKQVPTILTYQSRGKWRVAKVLVTAIDEERVTLACIQTGPRPQPINIRPGQSVGVSFKLPCGKCIFDTRVMALQAPTTPTSAGDIVVSVPDGIEVIQRRSYFRVNVPESMTVAVTLWHRRTRQRRSNEPCQYYHGRLIDISAGGAQIALQSEQPAATDDDVEDGADPADEAPGVHTGQFIEMRVVPFADEEPLLLTGQVRNSWPSSDDSELFLGLQIVGLEATPEGHQTLSKLISIVDRFHAINQAAAEAQESPEAARYGN